MKIIKYTKDYKEEWDKFETNCKNSHFFFQRNYIEYHSDKFKDFSLMFFNKNEQVIAILPANIKDNTLYTHQGLTFGGFIVDDAIKTEVMLDIFEALKDYLKAFDISKVFYKCIPYIYHTRPSEEDRYALFINDARLVRRDVTTTLYLDNKIKYQDQRRRAIKKAIKNNLIFEEATCFKEYWKVLEETLSTQHKTKPVHTLVEIEKLARMFPNNIRLFVAKKDNVTLGGTLIFENNQIVHTQYLANSLEGRKQGALDFVIDKLINEVYVENKKYFDFGTSNEEAGRFLNAGLIAQKEGFGARAVVHDFYELEIK